MYCILSATKYIKIKVSQNIPIYTYSATLAFNRISILKYLKTTGLECRGSVHEMDGHKGYLSLKRQLHFCLPFCYKIKTFLLRTNLPT